MCRYSLRKLNFMPDISQEDILQAVQKSMQVCCLAGINSLQHFKEVHVFNAEQSNVQIDWSMTKIGLDLMVMQTPSLNKPMAR